MKKIKSENQILIMLAFFSIWMGLWENFRQLWLQDNGFSATNISNIISIGIVISVIGIMFVGKYIKLERLKRFVSCALIIKFLNLIFLLSLNNKGNMLNNISVILDVLTGYLVTTSIYPLITTIAMTWSILISTSYENICDGYYINRVENKYQLTFTNFRYVVRYLGEAVGVFLCGMMYEIGLKYMFGLSAFFLIFQIGLAYYLIYLRKKEKYI